MTSKSPSPDFIFRRCDFDSPEELSEIYRLCFGTTPSPHYFKWKYVDNPAGRAIAFVAIHNNTVAGFYGVIPEFFMINGKVQTIYQSMDTMTHPQYRRMGLFAKLANMTYDYIRQKDGQLHLIGFPGEMSFSGFVDKLHWQDIIRFKYLFTSKLLFRPITLLSSFSNYRVEKITTFGEEFDSYFEQKELVGRPIAKYINRSIINWRLANHPDIHYEIAKIVHDGQLVGYFSYRLHDNNTAFLVNIDVLKTELFKSCLNVVCHYLFSEKKIRAIYTFQSGKNLKKAYYRSGFLSNPFSKGPFSYRTPFIVYGDKEISGLDWFNPNNFYIQPIVRDY
jgi:hypothetical protein